MMDFAAFKPGPGPEVATIASPVEPCTLIAFRFSDIAAL